MEYAYATLLLNESGEEINEKNLTAVLDASGCAVEESRIKAIVAALEDVELDDVGVADISGETDHASGESVDAHDDRDILASSNGGVVSDGNGVDSTSDDDEVDSASNDEDIDLLKGDTDTEISESPPDDEAVAEK